MRDGRVLVAGLTILLEVRSLGVGSPCKPCP